VQGFSVSKQITPSKQPCKPNLQSFLRMSFVRVCEYLQ
jgi:hypothetical protein